jgi:hypothetical protein
VPDHPAQLQPNAKITMLPPEMGRDLTGYCVRLSAAALLKVWA